MYRYLFFLLFFSFSTFLSAQNASEVEERVPVPDPLELEGNWWQYFDVSSEKMPQTIEAFKDSLEKQYASLTEENHGKIFEMVDDVLLNLKLLKRKKSETVPKGPPQLQFLNEYTLAHILAGNQRLMDAKNEITRLHEKSASQRNRLSRIQSELDEYILHYHTLPVSSYERLLTGLSIIEKRTEYAVFSLDIENLNERLQYYENKKRLLSDELQQSRAKLTLANLSKESLIEKKSESQAEFKKALKQLDELEKEGLRKEGEQLQSEFFCCLSDYRVMTQTISVENLRIESLIDEIKLTFFEMVQAGNGADDDKIRGLFSSWEEQLSDASEARRQWQNRLESAYAEVSRVIAKMIKDEEDRTAQQDEAIADIHFELDQSFALLQNLKVNIENAELLVDYVQSHFVDERPLAETWVITVRSFWENVKQSFEDTTTVTLFYVNEKPVTIGVLLKALLTIIAALFVSRYFRKVVSNRLTPSRTFSSSTRYIILRLTHYAIVIIGFLIALSFIGLDFTNLAIVAGALGVGIGFGLQSIVNNILSGFMLLLNRYLKVGDIVEMEGSGYATVKGINLQNTHICTFDGADIIIPNSQLSSRALTNWTMQNYYRRYRIPFGVAYGTDKDKLRNVIVDAIKKLPYVVVGLYPYTDPEVWFIKYGDSSVNFELVAWVDLNVQTPHGIAPSSLLWEVDNVLNEHRVVIPFPQRDLHITGLPVEGKMPPG